MDNVRKDRDKLITGVILAGGKSKRMGCDKATLQVHNRLLIEYPLRVFNELFKQTLIVTNVRLLKTLKNELKSYRNIKFYKDIFPGHGALGGIYTALINSDTPFVFVTACDMPFINREFVEYMTQLAVKSQEYDIIIPMSSGGIETLHAIYKRSLVRLIREYLKKNNNKIKEFFNYVTISYVPEEIVKKFESDERMFKHINTPQDLSEYLI